MEFHLGKQRVDVEVMDDHTLHFVISPSHHDLSRPLPVTPYVDSRDYPRRYPGPSRYGATSSRLTTAALELTVDRDIVVQDVISGDVIVRLRPGRDLHHFRELVVTSPGAEHAYGLGEQFLPQRQGQTDGGWIGQVRYPGSADRGLADPDVFGNEMVPYNGGMDGNAQFPILYVLRRQAPDYSLYLDDVYRQRWDLTGRDWVVKTAAPSLQFYVTVEDGLPRLRRDYMNLVGRPPVPPRKAFGLSVSEYGFDNWEEMMGKLHTLRQHHFPIDGFMLDLQWFGGIKSNSVHSHMGHLAFDRKSFPRPAATVRKLKAEQGIGLMTIEEPYVSKGLLAYRKMGRRGFLARRSKVEMATPEGRLAHVQYVNENPWWGLGGIIDYTNPAAGAYWHDLKRQKLVDMGVFGHWTDLGEPEAFRHVWPDGHKTTPYYYGFPGLGRHSQADINNVYALDWARSIYRGYRRHHVQRRLFILGRTGGPGIERYGVAMWSGDIGSRGGNLATQYNVQMNLVMSGIDYFGSDIGGFHRSAFDGSKKEFGRLYTRWFADGCLTDVPLRPHTQNLSNTRETAPDRVGNRESNLQNLRLRYRLIPYYYSLAYRAHLFGDPVVAPLVYYFPRARCEQDGIDPEVLGDHKMIGPSLLGVVATDRDATTHRVYLPPGRWVDFHSGQWYFSRGLYMSHYPIVDNGLLRLPLFARAGGIIPEMYVDAETMNSFGRRLDGTRRNALILKVVPSKRPSSFTLYEDDGRTVAYLHGATQTTLLRQQRRGDQEIVTVEPTRGHYRGAPGRRVYQLELFLPPGASPGSATLNGRPVEVAQKGALAILRTRSLPVVESKVFRVRLQ